MKRGVVVELDDDFVTLLTPDGQFLKASNNEGNYELGEEISFFPLTDKREEAAARTIKTGNKTFFDHFRTRTARVGALSAVAIIFFMISFLPFFNNDKVYAYMSIDINPSFEVSLDNELKVISLIPLNEEAHSVINNLGDWQKKPLNEVVQTIVNQCKSDGYVYPGKEIVITTVMNEADKNIEDELQAGITEIRSTIEEEEMVVKTIESDLETRDKAQKQGVSTGKYIELVKQKDQEENIQDLNKETELLLPTVHEEKQETSSIPNNFEKESNKPDKIVTEAEGINPETKEKLNDAKEKLKENASKSNQDLQKNLSKNLNKENNNGQITKQKQQERKEGQKKAKSELGNNDHKESGRKENNDNKESGRKENNANKNNGSLKENKVIKEDRKNVNEQNQSEQNNRNKKE